MKPKRIKALEEFTSKTVGDGKSPDLYFVTDQGTRITVTRNFPLAYWQWKQLSHRRPLIECALENRKTGVLCSVEPEDEGSQNLVINDDARRWGFNP